MWLGSSLLETPIPGTQVRSTEFSWRRGVGKGSLRAGAITTTWPVSWHKPTLLCSRRTVKACQRSCWRPLLVLVQSSLPTCPDVERSCDQTLTDCWCLRVTREPWLMRSGHFFSQGNLGKGLDVPGVQSQSLNLPKELSSRRR